MPETEIQTTEQTRSEPQRGFGSVPCIRCGETGTVSVSLDDVANFSCTSCDEEFEAETVRTVLEAWAPVLDWIAKAPEVK
jgi:transcription elongation factor Elf1